MKPSVPSYAVENCWCTLICGVIHLITCPLILHWVLVSVQIEDYGLVSFVPMNILDEESVELVLAHIDNAMQFGEEAEPKEPEEELEPRGRR
jgi:hypothetical protein